MEGTWPCRSLPPVWFLHPHFSSPHRIQEWGSQENFNVELRFWRGEFLPVSLWAAMKRLFLEQRGSDPTSLTWVSQILSPLLCFPTFSV